MLRSRSGYIIARGKAIKGKALEERVRNAFLKLRNGNGTESFFKSRKGTGTERSKVEGTEKERSVPFPFLFSKYSQEIKTELL